MSGYIGIESTKEINAQNRNRFVAGAGQTLFGPATYTPGFVDIFQNGIKLDVGTDVVASNGTSFTLNTPAVLGDILEYSSLTASAPWDVYSKAQADARFGNYYGIAAGSGDAMTTTTVPVITALADGMEIKIRTPSPNVAANPSLTIMGSGVSKTIYKYGGLPVQPGEWGTNQEITIRYNQAGNRFELISNTLAASKVTLTDAASITWDVSQGTLATLTLAGTGRTMANPANLKVGTLTLIIKQDTTGSRTISTWGTSFKWPGGTAPVLTTAANAVDIITFTCDGTNLYGSVLKNFL